MLPKVELVKVTRAVGSLYSGRCTITEHHKVKRENKSTGFEDVVVLENQPCRLSINSINSTSTTESGASALTQTIKLFISPDVKVKPGSKITVTQNGKTVDYKNSGEPAYYSTHQEIILELFKEWS